jgi:hypothetical protein
VVPRTLNSQMIKPMEMSCALPTCSGKRARLILLASHPLLAVVVMPSCCTVCTVQRINAAYTWLPIHMCLC